MQTPSELVANSIWVCRNPRSGFVANLVLVLSPALFWVCRQTSFYFCRNLCSGIVANLVLGLSPSRSEFVANLVLDCRHLVLSLSPTSYWESTNLCLRVASRHSTTHVTACLCVQRPVARQKNLKSPSPLARARGPKPPWMETLGKDERWFRSLVVDY